MVKNFFKSKKVSLLMLCVLLVYGFHFLLRVFASDNFGDSDAYEALMLDTLEFGYAASGGPLYTWILHFIVGIFGFNVASFLFFKYSMVIAIYYLCYLIYLFFSSSKRWGVVASLSIGSCYFMIWRLHEVMTQRLLTTLIGMLILFYYFYCSKSKIGFFQSVSMGILIGFGLLTECYILVVIFSLLLTSVFSDTEWSGGKFTVALIVGTLVSMPFYAWLVATGQFWQFFLGDGQFGSYQHNYLSYLRSAILHPLYVVSPALILLAPFFYARKIPNKSESALLADVHLINYFLWCYAVWLLFFGLFFPLKNNEVQAALPVFLPVLIILFLKLESRAVNLKKLIFILCIFPIISIIFRIGNLLILEPFCRNCRWAVPYDGLAKSIENCIYQNDNLIVLSNNADILSNLKRYHNKRIYTLIDKYESVLKFDVNGNYLFIDDISNGSNFDVELRRNSSIVEISWKQPYLNFSRKFDRVSKWHISSGKKVDLSCVNSINER